LLARGGLWGLAGGHGTNGGNSNSILFTVGINGGRDGMFGSLTPVLPGTPVGDFDFVAVGGPWTPSLAMVTTGLLPSDSGDAPPRVPAVRAPTALRAAPRGPARPIATAARATSRSGSLAVQVAGAGPRRSSRASVSMQM